MKPTPAGLGRPVSETVISREVIAAIAAHAAAATPGVIRMEANVSRMLANLGRTARQRIAGISPAPVTGTSATVVDGRVSIRVEVAVSGDRQVAETAAAVQRSVARAVTDGTGLLVAGVTVAILDIGLDVPAFGRGRAGREAVRARRDCAAAADGTPVNGPVVDGPVVDGTVAENPGVAYPAESRAQVCEAVVRAVRSVPGLRPASPVRPERARWMPWDPAILAVGLTGGYLEVALAATRLPLPPLLEQAADAIRVATAPTRWAALPHRLVVAALDAGALTGPDTFSPPGRDEPADGVSVLVAATGEASGHPDAAPKETTT